LNVHIQLHVLLCYCGTSSLFFSPSRPPPLKPLNFQISNRSHGIPFFSLILQQHTYHFFPLFPSFFMDLWGCSCTKCICMVELCIL
jgi:hypothetical protein